MATFGKSGWKRNTKIKFLYLQKKSCSKLFLMLNYKTLLTIWIEMIMSLLINFNVV